MRGSGSWYNASSWLGEIRPDLVDGVKDVKIVRGAYINSATTVHVELAVG